MFNLSLFCVLGVEKVCNIYLFFQQLSVLCFGSIPGCAFKKMRLLFIEHFFSFFRCLAAISLTRYLCGERYSIRFSES